MLDLHTEVKYVKGVGPRVAEWLAQKNIFTVEDLLYYLPFRYEDRLNPRGIAELRPGEMATVIAEVRNSAVFRTKRMPIFEMVAGQGPAKIKCIWFHGEYLRDRFKPGQLVALYGKVEEGWKGRGLQIAQPQFEILDGADERGLGAEGPEAIGEIESLEVGRIVPIYESAASGRLTSRWFRRVVHCALENLAAEIPDGLPPALCRRLQLLDRRAAFQQVHFPQTGEVFADLAECRTPAHRRLIFEELFFLEVGLELKRRRMRQRAGIAFALNDNVREAIKKILPFHPTVAQRRVLKEIAEDMQQPSPMRRLLQGDVGSGKTIVALQAAVIAIENGYQAAFMAPTEILATQHYLSARRVLEPAGYRVVLLTGSQDPEVKRNTRRHIAQGGAHLVIGTHALIQEKVEFHNLGLVIVDEQHRFGVMQRFKLMKKGDVPPRHANIGRVGDPGVEPDTLVMTATPIPRTLALTLYGDLDTSVLDELPPGRTPITTRKVSDDRAPEVWEFVRKQVKAGRQAYVVYPVIEGTPAEPMDFQLDGEAASAKSGKTGLKAAIHMYDQLRKKVFPDLRVGLLHGRLEAEEKDQTMRKFQQGEIDVLVSTTVIEVGVDVANATVMVVEHAERFGLAQMHQLRGRIGRGAAKSYCVLMTGGKISPEGERRLNEMARTQDGFEIAELDLELRGPGEFFGTKQAGMPGLRVANILRDRKLLELAKIEAARIVEQKDPEITRPDRERIMQHLRQHWQRRYGLVEVG
ncbi:MAG TPA: ATP-dependent DNA helicase RecG [Candidatus Angelobacter sp.]|nr:ATP-dependent DNA helicase RecG [Candidatus Angelobacter sp.]